MHSTEPGDECSLHSHKALSGFSCTSHIWWNKLCTFFRLSTQKRCKRGSELPGGMRMTFQSWAGTLRLWSASLQAPDPHWWPHGYRMWLRGGLPFSTCRTWWQVGLWHLAALARPVWHPSLLHHLSSWPHWHSLHPVAEFSCCHHCRQTKPLLLWTWIMNSEPVVRHQHVAAILMLLTVTTHSSTRSWL